MDLRILKTHKALITTFLLLLEQKHFEDITVKELCDVSMVRRATFYKHFADKYEFSIFVFRELQHQFYAEHTIQYDEIRPKSYYIDVLRKTIAFISQNEKLVHSILQSNMSPSLLNVLADEIAFNLKFHLKKDEAKGAVLPASPEILAPFYTGALTQVIRWWLMQKDRLSEEQLVEELLKIINFSIEIKEN